MFSFLRKVLAVFIIFIGAVATITVIANNITVACNGEGNFYYYAMMAGTSAAFIGILLFGFWLWRL